MKMGLFLGSPVWFLDKDGTRLEGEIDAFMGLKTGTLVQIEVLKEIEDGEIISELYIKKINEVYEID